MKCLLCGSSAPLKFNLKFDHSLYSQKQLYDLIDFLFEDVTCDHYNICRTCYNVLNELDSLKMKCDIIYYKFKSQLSKTDDEEVEIIEVKTENYDSDKESATEVENIDLASSSGEINKTKSVKIELQEKEVKKTTKAGRKASKESKAKNVKEKTVCEICGKDVHNLNMHKQIHNPVRLKCDLCDVTFSLRSSLWRHKRIHSGEKYQCELCGKQFTHKTSFKAHMMIHSGNKTIDCHLCDMKFYTKGHLNRHLRLHYDEKPYECPFCPRRFREKYNMKLHERTIHKTEKIAPESC